jgi:glycosyltransferase involved in cell wall biosynthesis
MKVLWFSNTPALGVNYIDKNSVIKGTGGWLYSLNKELQNVVDLSITFHYPYKISDFTFENTKYYPIYTGNIIIENLKRRFFKNIYNTDFLNQYLKIIKKINPDIIHIHGTENSFLCLLGKTEIPIVISIQGNLNVISHKFNVGFNGKYLNCKIGKITLKSLFFGRDSFFNSYQNMKKMAKIETNYFKLADYVIGRTDWDNRISRIFAPKSKYFFGSELLRDRFYLEQWKNDYKGGKIVLFSTNGDNYYKGFETICYTLKLLYELDMNVEWRVAGVSESSLINIITKKELKDNYPKEGLILLGKLDVDELINNLKGAHIYIMASHIENSPNNLCEAMFLGMPCIATFAGGTGSLLNDGEEGILIQDGDPWAMAGAVVELMNDLKKALTFGKNARKRALLRHDKEIVSEQYVLVYRNILNLT